MTLEEMQDLWDGMFPDGAVVQWTPDGISDAVSFTSPYVKIHPGSTEEHPDLEVWGGLEGLSYRFVVSKWELKRKDKALVEFYGQRPDTYVPIRHPFLLGDNIPESLRKDADWQDQRKRLQEWSA